MFNSVALNSDGLISMHRTVHSEVCGTAKKDIGLWIDHRKAMVVTISNEGEEITSHMEKHVRFASGASEDGSSEDVRDRQFGNHLNNYYDAIIAVIRDGDTIQIFGPGEAKGELEKRLESKELGERVVRVETVDKMTDRQIAAKVREYLRRKKAPSVP
jgi:hypothetical protein